MCLVYGNNSKSALSVKEMLKLIWDNKVMSTFPIVNVALQILLCILETNCSS